MEQPFAEDISVIIRQSREVAIRHEQFRIDLDHLMLALTEVEESSARKLLVDLGCDINVLAQIIVESFTASEARKDGNIPLTRLAESILKGTYMEAYNLTEDELLEMLQSQSRPSDRPIKSEHMLLSMLREADHPVVQNMKAHWGVDYQKVKEAFE